MFGIKVVAVGGSLRGTEVIETLIDQLALGLQKWVGWKDGDKDKCCLKGDKNGESTGIGRKCDCSGLGGAANCCGTGGSGTTTCHQCTTCGTGDKASNKCYLSAYCKKTASSGASSGGQSEGQYYWPTLSAKPDQVHLLARIFLGSVCLIWSGLSQLGFLTGDGKRWSQSKLHEIETGDSKGLGSFMAAMGYNLERLNQGQGNTGKTGSDVADILSKEKTGAFQELKNGDASKGSVAEYYSSIYGAAQDAGKSSTTEKLCEQYPLLVLHILASGYFRAGSAGAKGVITPPAKPAEKKDNKPRHPRTIREILYWLSALPYSQGYRELVGRMGQKYPRKEGNPKEFEKQIELHGDSDAGASTTLLQKDITHYLMAACGYCPLVLIGIQGTIATSGTETTPSGVPGVGVPGVGVPGAVSPAASDDKRCPEHKKDPSAKRCTLEESNKAKAAATAPAAAPAPGAGSPGKPLQAGEVCYGGYHLEVSKFGPLHGMYANGLYGFDMGGSAAQCLDQLRVYVYHCFYQLYFLRKQCSAEAVLGWKSCRYGKDVYWGSGANSSYSWICEAQGSAGAGEHTKHCGLQSGAGGQKLSPLMCFLCDGLGKIACPRTVGRGNIEDYPSIEDHMNMKSPFHPDGHLDVLSKHCPVPMGWKDKEHFKDLTTGSHKTDTLSQSPPVGQGTTTHYPAHCTGNTLSLLLEYYCDPGKPHGSLVVLLRLLACITPTVPRTLGDLFGFYYYIVYIGGNSASGGSSEVKKKLGDLEKEVVLYMGKGNAVVEALTGWSSGDCQTGTKGTLKCLTGCNTGAPSGQCSQYLSPLSGQQYGQLSPLMAGTYLSWLVYLIGEFHDGLDKLKEEFTKISCKDSDCKSKAGAASGCSNTCHKPTGGNNQCTCCCASVVSCTGVLPVLYKYGFGYGDVNKLHDSKGTQNKRCHEFLETLNKVLTGDHLRKDGNKGLHHEINQLIYTTRLPWIFVLTLAWLVAVLYLAFGAIWPLDWTHMRSHCRGWFRKGSLSPWEILMVGKKKGRGILEFFGGR